MFQTQQCRFTAGMRQLYNCNGAHFPKTPNRTVVAGIWHFSKWSFYGRNTIVWKLSPAGCLFYLFVERGCAVAVILHVLGNAPGGRNTHILRLVANVDVGSWISLGVAVICSFPDGLHIQHGSGFEVPSTCWANPIVHVPKRRSNTRFFCKFPSWISASFHWF